MIVISSPYAKRDALWDAYRKHYGPEGREDILVVQGASRTFNPDLPQSVVDRALEATQSPIEPSISPSSEPTLKPSSMKRSCAPLYRQGCGNGSQKTNILTLASLIRRAVPAIAMTMAISHREGEVVVLDAIRVRKPPFEPTLIVEEFASLARSYKCPRAYSDKYGGEWVVAAFRKCGLHIETAET